MAGIPAYPKTTNKWEKILEAKHPLIQDLIRIWDESTGYILPEWSFIRDKAKLEKLIDSMVEYEQNKKAAPPVAPHVLAAKQSANQNPEDPNWEKTLLAAISTVAVVPKKNDPGALPPLLPVPGAVPMVASPAAPVQGSPVSEVKLPPLPARAEEKLAKLKLLPARNEEMSPAQAGDKQMRMHVLIIYAISISAFILACYAIKH